jgi:hypothetical protein
VYAGGVVTKEDVLERVRRFAVLRGAQRALAPSSLEEMPQADLDAVRGIRERLGALVLRFEARDRAAPPAAPDGAELARDQDELASLDGALQGFARILLGRLESIALSQLRASVSVASPQERTEALALLELCLEGEPGSPRLLHVVDFLITLLCATRQGGVWLLATDPANLNEALRRRCWSAAPCGPDLESMIARRFQDASLALARGGDVAAVVSDISDYKQRIASFYFVPGVLRCIVGYNVAARNHFEERRRLGRERDSAIDDELGQPEDAAAPARPAALPAHESPGVLAVQEAIRRRLMGADSIAGPAARIADALDVSWLETSDREAFLEVQESGILRVVRMTVVLGHLAMVLPTHPTDLEALGLDAEQLDAWICDLGEEVQREINALIHANSYAGALRLGDTKSRFLAAVLLVARRRQGKPRKQAGADEADAFHREAIALVREHLNRARLGRGQKPFVDLFGGGWRRSAAFAAVGVLAAVLVAAQLRPAGPRAVAELDPKDVSLFVRSAYRDHAANGSVFVATMTPEWEAMGPAERRFIVEKISSDAIAEGVAEIMVFDADLLLQAHWTEGEWRDRRAWAEAPAGR